MGFVEKFYKVIPSSFEEEQFENIKFRLSRPDGETTGTAIKKYPLVVYLHDASKRGTDNLKPISGLGFLGNGSGIQAREFQEKFPCFVYVPQCPLQASWVGETLDDVIKTIEHLKVTYPIDRERLYLIGYSMGGSGTYALASKYFDFNGQLFAGIIRLAGQSSFDDHVNEIIAKSSVWIHIGLQDTPLRIEKARESYAALRNIYKNSPEATQIVNISGQQGKTFTLEIDNQERIKMTEYFSLGHDIKELTFNDPAVLEWLFQKKLP